MVRLRSAAPGRSTAVVLVAAAALAALIEPAGVRAQAPPNPPAEADAGVDAAAAGPPRTVVIDAPLPDIPATRPARFVALPFANTSGVRALDWLVAGLPAALADKLEHVMGLEPAGGDLVVEPMPPAAGGDAGAVAARARAAGAAWAIAGSVTRTNWELDLTVRLWRVDLADPAAAATVVGEVHRVGPFAEVHRFVGEAIAELAPKAGWPLGDARQPALVAAPTPDLYAYTLLGRGLGRLIGVLGPAGPVDSPITVTAVEAAAAERDLGRAIFIDPSFALGQRLVGEVWRRFPVDDKQARRAVGKFNYALDLRPDDVPALRACAAAALEAGKHPQARELYERLVRQRPWDLPARLGLGQAAWGTGDAEAARRELTRLLAADPSNLPARRVMALIRAAAGDTVGLLGELEAIRGLAPDDLSVHADLVATYAALGRYADARASLAVVSAAHPDDGGLQVRAGDLARWSGDAPAAAAAYARAQELAPDDPRGYFLGAALASSGGDLDGARRILVRAQRFKELLPWTQYALGAVELRRGAPGEALWYLQRAARGRPRALAPRLALVTAQLQRGDLAAAETELTAAAASWPDDPDRLYLAGMVALARGRVEDARVAWARAPGHDASVRAQQALSVGRTPTLEPVVPDDAPVGDARALAAHVTAFARASAQLATLRDRAQLATRKVLAVLGEGPSKPSKPAKGPAPARSRICPLAQLVRPWSEADQARAAFIQAGLSVDELGAWIERAAALGGDAGLLPHERVQLTSALREFQLARADLRELSAMWTVGVGRELAYVRCRPELLAAAAADPRRYPPAPPPAPPAPVASKPALPPRRATFYVDNRSCGEPFSIYVDGQPVGQAPPGERRAASAPIGRRSVCLLAPGRAVCGDRGTVREVYLHDGWEVVMKCPPP